MAIPIKHVSLKVSNLERARAFCEEVLGYKHVRTAHSNGLDGNYISCHMTDGSIDLALQYFGDPESGNIQDLEPSIDHFGWEVDDMEAFVQKIEAWGGTVLIRHSAQRLKFKLPDLPIMEIVQAGRWTTPIAAIKMSDD